MDNIQTLRTLNKEKLTFVSNKAYRRLLSINDDKLAEQVAAGNETALDEWDDMCADILHLHAIRFVLHNKPIPIDRESVGQDLSAMGKEKVGAPTTSITYL